MPPELPFSPEGIRGEVWPEPLGQQETPEEGKAGQGEQEQGQERGSCPLWLPLLSSVETSTCPAAPCIPQLKQCSSGSEAPPDKV